MQAYQTALPLVIIHQACYPSQAKAYHVSSFCKLNIYTVFSQPNVHLLMLLLGEYKANYNKAIEYCQLLK